MRIEAWQTLVHVCRRWRNLALQSPHRLNLRLYCTPRTPARDGLDVWPALPLLISGTMRYSEDTVNIIAALGQSNRICQVDLWGLQLGKVLAPMQVSFPELTDLHLVPDDRYLANEIVIPDAFLGGSAPRLRILELGSFLYPGLAKLLLSATSLVGLYLRQILYSTDMLPEAIVPALSMLSSLESLKLDFKCSWPRPDRERTSFPPQKCSILPALAKFYFEGPIEYLEQLVARIDTPQLEKMSIFFFYRFNFNFYCPRLVQFVNRTPTLRALGDSEAHVQFHERMAVVILRYRASKSSLDGLCIESLYREIHRQLSFINRSVTPPLHFLSTVEDLYFDHRSWDVDWEELEDEAPPIGNDLWFELLLPFFAAKNLYLSEEFAPDIAASLQEFVGDRLTEVLPKLQHIFVEKLEPSGPIRENIGKFVAARQLSSHSQAIVISVWDRFAKRMKST